LAQFYLLSNFGIFKTRYQNGTKSIKWYQKVISPFNLSKGAANLLEALRLLVYLNSVLGGQWGEHPIAEMPRPGLCWLMKHNHFSPSQKQPAVSAARSAPAATQSSENESENESEFVPEPDEVARKAYFAYENNGSQPGHEVQHWLQAEADLIAERNATRTHSFYDQR